MSLVWWNILLRGLGVLMCFGGAIFLAYHKLEGWGWMLFIGLLMGAFTVGGD